MWKFGCVVLVIAGVMKTAGFCSDLTAYPDRYYAQGMMNYKEGDLPAARNAWRKYLAFCRLRPDSCAKARVRDVEALLENTEPAAAAVPLPSPVPARVDLEPAPAERPRRTRSPEKLPPRLKMSKEKMDKTSRELAREAEQARERGQLEHALSLYQLAEQVEPEGEEFKSQVEELKQLME